jgi:hypothetical protein
VINVYRVAMQEIASTQSTGLTVIAANRVSLARKSGSQETRWWREQD